MTNRKLRPWVIKLRTGLIYTIWGLLALLLLFYIAVGAILQTSYKHTPITQQEIQESYNYD